MFEDQRPHRRRHELLFESPNYTTKPICYNRKGVLVLPPLYHSPHIFSMVMLNVREVQLYWTLIYYNFSWNMLGAHISSVFGHLVMMGKIIFSVLKDITINDWINEIVHWITENAFLRLSEVKSGWSRGKQMHVSLNYILLNPQLLGK